MVRRSTRGKIHNTKPIIEKLNAGRSAAINVCTQAKISSAEYKAAEKVTKAIDELANELTGDPEKFWNKMHST